MSTVKSPKVQQKQSVMRSAISMAVGTFSSRILGFLRDAIMFALFSRGVTDAWVVAFRLPNIFRRILGEGSLSPSFIPIYVEARAHSEEQARKLSNAIFSIVFAVSTVITVACFVYMDQIMWYLIGDPQGFASDPAKVEQTIYLARIMIFYLMLVSTFAFHMAVANTHGQFFIPALGPTLFNLGMIITVLPSFDFGPYPGTMAAWGVIIGGVLQVGIVFWLLFREDCLPKLTFNWNVSGVVRVFGNMVPGLFGLGVFQIMTLVNTKFAARLSEGAQSYIYAADRILELPQSLIAVSLGAALLPRFSELSAAHNRNGFLKEANQAVRTLLYLSLPAAVGMFVLSKEITQVLFMRGAFDLNDARQTGQIVEIYSVLLLFSSLSRITAPAFYAIKNTWLPAAVAAVILIIHISIGPYLIDHFGLPGLAYATSTSSILNIVILQVFFHYWIGPLGYPKIFMSTLRQLPALLGLGVFCYLTYDPIADLLSQKLHAGVSRGSALALVISVGMVIYFYLSIVFGCEEAMQVKSMVTRRLRKKT